MVLSRKAFLCAFLTLLAFADGLHEAVQCWGKNSEYRCATPSPTFIRSPYEVFQFSGGPRVEQVSAGQMQSCVLLSDDSVQCWGANAGLGRGGGAGETAAPGAVIGLAGTATYVTCGVTHCCVLLVDGRIQCWGSNVNYEVYSGTTTSYGFPADPISFDFPVVGVNAGDRTTCVWLENGDAYCRGRNTYGRLGVGFVTTNEQFYLQLGTTKRILLIASTENHMCAVTSEGELLCWGDNRHGQMGLGYTTTQEASPVQVTLPGVVSHVSVGSLHVCAVVEEALYCWGGNADGQLGVNSYTNHYSPQYVMSGVKYVAAGKGHTCAFLVTGQMKCFGDNSLGQLGNGDASGDDQPDAASAPDMSLAGFVYRFTDAYDHICVQTSCCPIDQYATLPSSYGDDCATSCTLCDNCVPGEGASTVCDAQTNSVCEACVVGDTFSPDDSLRPCLVATVCEAGERVLTAANATTDRTCAACIDGVDFTDSPNQPSCSPCSACASGTEQIGSCMANSDTPCQTCANGTSSVGGGASCDPCGAQEYAPAGSPACYPCALPARQPMYNAGECVCSPGYGGDFCDPCPIGYFKEDPGNHACTPCRSLFSTVLEASTSASDCMCGTGAEPFSATCVLCPLGTYKDTVSNDACSPCPHPYRSTSEGASRPDECDECVDGYYGPSCTECPFCDSGGECSDGVTGTGVCSCSATTGWHGPACNECTDYDWFGPDCDQRCTCNTEAGPCDKGLSGSGTCLSCDYGDTSGPDCKDCKPGRMPYAPGINDLCMVCPRGTETVNDDDEVGCIDCPPGQFQPLDDQSVLCQECPIGSVAPFARTADCNPCGYGFNQSQSGQTECDDCGLGYTTESATAAACVPCVGLEEWLSGPLANCTDCRLACGCFPGEERIMSGSPCTTCPSGTFKAEFGDGPCLPCAEHSAAPPGSTECIPCPQSPEFMYVSEDGSRCLCLPGFYLDQTEQCVECPEGADCAGATAAPVNIAGYHCSGNNLDGEPSFHKCPASAGTTACRDNCTCAPWHDEGSLGCSACLPGSYRPATSSDRMCKECEIYPLWLLATAAISIMIAGSLSLLYIARRSKAFFPSLIVGLNFVQIISVLSHFSIEWPPVLSNFFLLMSVFTIDISIVHPECAFPETNAYPTIWFFKFFTPFFVFLLFLFCYAVIAVVCYYMYRIPPEAVGTERTDWEKRVLSNVYTIDVVGGGETMKNTREPWKEHLREFKYNLTNAFLTMLSVVYLVTALTTLEIFVCTKVDNSDGSTSSSLNESPTIRCNPGADATYALLMSFAILGIFLYVIGIPSLFFAILYRNRFRLGQAPVVAKFGLLYRRYSLKTYYWDVVVTLRKLAVVVARCFLASIPILQVVMCLVVAIVSMVATRKFSPFLSPRINKLENTCLACAVIILFVGLVYGSIAEATGSDPSKGWEIGSTFLGILCILIWAVCIGFVAYTFYIDVDHLRRRLRHGIPDDDGDDDVQTMDEFYENNVRILAYHKILSRGNKQSQQQVRICFSIPEALGLEVGMRFSTLLEYLQYHCIDATGNIKSSVKEPLEDSVFKTIPPNVLIQKHSAADRDVYMMDMLMPFPDQFAMEIFVRSRGKKTVTHILHLIVNADDDGGPAPGGGKVATLNKDFTEERQGILYTPTQAVLIADASVAFRCQAPGAKSVYVQRNIREEKNKTTEDNGLSTLMSAMDNADCEAKQAMQAALAKQEEYKANLRANTVAVRSLLEPVGASKSIFVSDSVRISSGDEFQLVAVYEEGEKVTEVTVASYTAVSAEEVGTSTVAKKKKAPPPPPKQAKPKPVVPPKPKKEANPVFEEVSLVNDDLTDCASDIELVERDYDEDEDVFCELCEVDAVEVYCEDCYLSLCGTCSTRYHRAKNRRNHAITYYYE